MIKTKNLNSMLPLLEAILAKVKTPETSTKATREIFSSKEFELANQLNETHIDKNFVNRQV